jgi:uncharacterized SAM-binding protein YcdF (DUF218 family)
LEPATEAGQAALRAADFLWFIFSSGGVVLVFLLAVAWLFLKPKSRAARIVLVFAVLGYAAASIYPIPHAIERWLASPFHPLTRADVAAGRTVVVLLGSGSSRREDWSDVRFSLLDPIGFERTLEAARLYRLLNPDYVISSGGVVQDDSVGAAMKNALIQLGVPADRILVEGKSLNTRDEAVLVAAMLPPLNVEHVVLVTSPIHMRRSVGLFRAVGINVIPAVARQHEYSGFLVHLLPSDAGLRTSALAVHEILGMAYYGLRGQLK